MLEVASDEKLCVESRDVSHGLGCSSECESPDC